MTSIQTKESIQDVNKFDISDEDVEQDYICEKSGKSLKNNSNSRFHNSEPLLPWNVAQRMVAWDLIILIGAGYALAEVSERSCLSAWIGSWLGLLDSLADWVIALIGSVIGSVMTQIMSNAAASGILLPILRFVII